MLDILYLKGLWKTVLVNFLLGCCLFSFFYASLEGVVCLAFGGLASVLIGDDQCYKQETIKINPCCGRWLAGWVPGLPGEWGSPSWCALLSRIRSMSLPSCRVPFRWWGSLWRCDPSFRSRNSRPASIQSSRILYGSGPESHIYSRSLLWWWGIHQADAHVSRIQGTASDGVYGS